jgi:hypothetical protein
MRILEVLLGRKLQNQWKEITYFIRHRLYQACTTQRTAGSLEVRNSVIKENSSAYKMYSIEISNDISYVN